MKKKGRKEDEKQNQATEQKQLQVDREKNKSSIEGKRRK